MRKISTLAMIFFCSWTSAFAQFSSDQLEFRLGYNLHNARAKNFNHLITVFNNDRFPAEITENLGSVNFLHGMLLGGSYAFSEDLSLYAQLKSDRQYLETRYVDEGMYRSFLFRQHSLEIGLSMPLSEEGRFQHRAGGGIVLGVLAAYTDWSAEEGYQGARKMLNIDRSELLGLNVNYEARFVLHDNIHIFLRPNLQLSLNSQLRKLSNFFNPVVQEDGILYLDGEGEKYNKGNLNGVGIEGGLIILLPQF